jgi:hypothetical protein
VREFLGTLGCRPSLKLLQDRGQTFRDGLLGGIQLGPERSPGCQQPRHSLCALIKPRRSTTFPFLVASSVKFGGINGHDDLGFTIIFDGRSLCDSSRSASAHSGPLTSRPSWAIKQRSACRCRRPYDVFLLIFREVCASAAARHDLNFAAGGKLSMHRSKQLNLIRGQRSPSRGALIGTNRQVWR